MCLWDNYVYYMISSEKEAEKILKENKEFEISQRDALVIGILKVVETENLIHRFNDHVIHTLSVRSIKNKENFLIKKKFLKDSVDKFLYKFPPYWEAPQDYETALVNLRLYISDVKEKIEKLETMSLTIQNIEHQYLNVNNVKKILNFNIF